MKLIWHIIKKDIVRDRAGLLVWAALFVAQVVIGFILLHYSEGRRPLIDNLQFASAALVVLQFLVCYALVVRLVQADALHGTDMFWVTRPISRGRLLLAKAGAALLLFGLLPVLLRLPWWLACDFIARDIFWTAVNMVGWQVVVIAPAFLLASFTSEFPRVLLWSLLMFVVVWMGFGLLASLFKTGGFEGEGLVDYNGIHYTRAWLMLILAMLLMGGLATYHYLSRRLVHTIVLTVGGLGAVMCVGWFSSANLSQELASLPRPAFDQTAMEAVAAVQVEVGRGLPDPRSNSRRSDLEQSLTTEIYFQGLPADMSVATGGHTWQSWRWADGLRIRRAGYISIGALPAEPLLRRTYALPEPTKDQETMAWISEKQRQQAADRVARGLKPLMQWKTVPPVQTGTRQMVFASVPSSMGKRALAEPPAYEATLDCVALKLAIVAELPIKKGAYAGEDSLRMRLLEIKPNDNAVNGMEVSFVLTAPMIQASGLWGVGEILSSGHRNVLNSLRGQIWSINRVTGDVLAHGRYSLQTPRRAFVAGVLLNWDKSRIGPGFIIRNGQYEPKDPNWTEHASLVLVAEKPVARFVARIKSDRLEFLPSRWLEEPEGAAASK